MGIVQVKSFMQVGNLKEKSENITFPTFDDISDHNWPDIFTLVTIPSKKDGNLQKAYFYASDSSSPQPLIISLHTWSGDYTQEDPLAKLCVEKNLNYIHPDFRGANNHTEACCSELAISDIDESISYAIENAKTKPSAIYLTGTSGGGYASICLLLKTKHKIDKFSAWVPVSDLEAWYEESKIRKNKYANDILQCSCSEGVPNSRELRERSPLYWKASPRKLKKTEVMIHTGIYDGIQGSVPITHSINFYNKLLTDLKAEEVFFVSDKEKLFLLEHRMPLGDFGSIGDRKLYLKKKYKNVELMIFEGNHELLPEYALSELLGE